MNEKFWMETNGPQVFLAIGEPDAYRCYEMPRAVVEKILSLPRERDEAVKRLEVLYARSETPGFIDQLLAERDEAVRERDELWAKAEGYEDILLAMDLGMKVAVDELMAKTSFEEVSRKMTAAHLQGVRDAAGSAMTALASATAATQSKSRSDPAPSPTG